MREREMGGERNLKRGQKDLKRDREGKSKRTTTEHKGDRGCERGEKEKWR